MTVYWDVETYSQIRLSDHGAHVYAAGPTGVFFLCYAIDDGPVETWRPGEPVPAPFADPAGFRFVSDNWEFERLIHEHILCPRFGFAPIPLENQDCAQRLALANAFPAELGLRCEALGLPYRKDPEARRAMHRLCRPQTAKKRKKPIDPAARECDLALLLARCQTDVAATRAAYTSPRLRPLLPQERQQLLLDATINARGIRANVPFLKSMRALAIQERDAVNARLNELTAGVITSVDQVARLKDAINARGHAMTTLGKRSVAATLAHQPDDFVRELLELRQRGAYASVRMAKRLLAYANPSDARIRGALRIFGAGPGRWSSPGAQLHNLRRNDAQYPASLVEAVITGDHAELARFGNPLGVAAELSRAALCAKPGYVLICADLGAIESRILAWLSAETWKLSAYAQYDQTGDKTLEPYRVIAARMLRKNDPGGVTSAERQLGKSAELAAGFGGSVGAWRRIAGDDGRTDAEVVALIRQWRDAHPAIRAFWSELARAARVAIRTGRPILVAPAPRPPIIAAFDGYALTLMLPSGRAINYPGARLVPNRKFEDADPDIEFFDNAQGQWKPARAWFGTLIENVVQGTARDLLAAALLRFEARALPCVFHCHDEVVIEIPEHAISESEILAILLKSPAWTTGLPLGGKVHTGLLYLESPATAEPPAPQTERGLDARALDADEMPEPTLVETIDLGIGSGPEAEPVTARGDDRPPAQPRDSVNGATVSLAEIIGLPLDSDGKILCPYHDDTTPSLHIYQDHFHCFSCGAHGGAVDWLVDVEGKTRDEALALLADWQAVEHPRARVMRAAADDGRTLASALRLWEAATSIAGTPALYYLSDVRGIDIDALPPDIDAVLRFHPDCPFGPGTRVPSLLALLRDVTTDEPAGIHRIALTPAVCNGAKVERRTLGRWPAPRAVKLWPAATDLVIGEGLETVLAAATKLDYLGTPLRPAWAAISAGNLARLPVIAGVERLVLLVDNDAAGQVSARRCESTWLTAERTVIRLTPDRAGADFNDIVLEELVRCPS